MELVNWGGMSYWLPVADREVTTINNFIKWEQAFRVFSNIYTSFHPSRAGELIQYNHIIYTAAQTYSWDNVYRYDKEFCIHMSRHHMNRKWDVILQQAWAMCLKDKVTNYTPNSKAGGNGNGHMGGGGPRKELCFDYNKGICTFGKRCKFDHRCSFCDKYGHGSHICQKAKASSGRPQIQNNLSDNNNSSERWEKYKQQRHKANNDKKK